MQYQSLMRWTFLIFIYTVAVSLSITLQGSNYTVGVKNNVNIVLCNCKQITSSYSAITECTLLHSWPNLGSIVKMFGWNFEKACDM